LVKIAALYHEAKLMELQNDQAQFQDKFEQEREAEAREQMARLSTPELKAYLYLIQKMNGEDPGEVPGFFSDNVNDAEPEQCQAPTPNITPPLPPPKSPFKPILSPVKGDELEEPGDSAQEEEQPKGLPPRPGKPIPGWDDSCMRGRGGARKA
jgi:hypothetical protein